MKEASPGSRRVGLLVGGTLSPTVLGNLRQAASPLGLELFPLEVQNAADIEAVFTTMTQQEIDSIMVFGGTLFTANRPLLIRLAQERRLPALYPSRLFLESGGLMDYAYVEAARGSHAADYVARILKGASPGDLAMTPPPAVELVVNLDAARAIGFTFPDSILARATEVLPHVDH